MCGWTNNQAKTWDFPVSDLDILHEGSVISYRSSIGERAWIEIKQAFSRERSIC